MKSLHSWFLLAATTALVGFVVTSDLRATHAPVSESRARAATAEPAVGGVRRILSATPFTTEVSWTHVWRREAPEFRGGWLLVLEVDSALVEPRQIAEPVLYAGGETVERVNHGYESGRVVAVLPSALDASGKPVVDLATTPFFFGAAELPERVDTNVARRELAAALARGVRPLVPPARGALRQLHTRDELDPDAGLLVLEHSPAETDLALGLLTPRNR